MKIGLLSKSTGVSKDAVRLYEKLGLLVDISRPYEYNNYKEYGEKNVDRIKMIKQMQSLGITLKESKFVLEALDGETLDQEMLDTFIHSKIAQIDEKIKDLQNAKANLLEALKHQDCPSAENENPQPATRNH